MQVSVTRCKMNPPSELQQQRNGRHYKAWLRRSQQHYNENAHHAREGNAVEDSQVPPSAQFQETMEMLMVGHLSCATANRMAVAQAADAAVMGRPMHPEMKMLAEIGPKGRFKQNLWRDLENKLRLEECNFPEPLYVPVPVLDSRLAFAWADFSFVRGGPRTLQINNFWGGMPLCAQNTVLASGGDDLVTLLVLSRPSAQCQAKRIRPKSFGLNGPSSCCRTSCTVSTGSTQRSFAGDS